MIALPQNFAMSAFPRLWFVIAVADRPGQWYLDETIHPTLEDAALALDDVVDPARRSITVGPASYFGVKVIGEDRPMRDVTFEACRWLVLRAAERHPVSDPVDAWVSEHLPQWLSDYMGPCLPDVIAHAARDMRAEALPLGALRVV